ncbi:MAG: YbaK/EbsC family protein [Candidatus Shapirobacteria bacterium]|jgi:prolyl-tRNA editing enzyme YbaK/EbsC (Cys-tRNA(Pro) deacylase)
MSDIPAEAKKIQVWLRNRGFDNQVVVMAKSATSIKGAAKIIGCPEEQVVETIIFKDSIEKRPVGLISNINNGDMKKILEKSLKLKLETASQSYIDEVSGFTIGQLPPIGHRMKIEILVDEKITKLKYVWAWAGSAKAFFKIEPSDLVEMSQGKVVNLDG